MLEFSSGSLPPFPPFRGCATDDKDAGGDDEGVPGDPEKKMFEYETFLEIKRIVSIKKYGSAAALLIGFPEQSSIKKVSHCLSKDFLSFAVTYFVPKFNDDQ